MSFSTSSAPHDGHEGGLPGFRTKYSKSALQAKQRYSKMGITHPPHSAHADNRPLMLTLTLGAERASPSHSHQIHEDHPARVTRAEPSRRIRRAHVFDSLDVVDVHRRQRIYRSVLDPEQIHDGSRGLFEGQGGSPTGTKPLRSKSGEREVKVLLPRLPDLVPSERIGPRSPRGPVASYGGGATCRSACHRKQQEQRRRPSQAKGPYGS